MGLIYNGRLNNGMSLNGMYVRVGFINGDKFNINFEINYYINQEFYKAGTPALQQEFFNFTPDLSEKGRNLIKQIYLFVKEMDKFKDCIDVLEDGQLAT